MCQGKVDTSFCYLQIIIRAVRLSSFLVWLSVNLSSLSFAFEGERGHFEIHAIYFSIHEYLNVKYFLVCKLVEADWFKNDNIKPERDSQKIQCHLLATN